jgi:hypothetical protein
MPVLSSEPISQSIDGDVVFTLVLCPAVGSAPATGAKASASVAIPAPVNAIFFMSVTRRTGR